MKNKFFIILTLIFIIMQISIVSASTDNLNETSLDSKESESYNLRDISVVDSTII